MAYFATKTKPGTRLLDVGCGTKPYASLFSCEYLGIDVEVSGRPQENKIADKYFDGVNIPEASGSFDFALSTQVLEHCTDPEGLLREVNRILKPRGLFLLTVPMIWGEHEAPYDFRRYTSFGIEKLAQEHGFELVEFQKITRGLNAIRTVISSESAHYLREHPVGWIDGLCVRFANFFLRVAFKLWKGRIDFERIYLDNCALLRKSDVRAE